MVPWKRGRLLLWDATCPDTFAPSYLADATGEAGDVAAAAERRKRTKYSNLTLTHLFVPVAMETTGVPGPETASFLKELSGRLRQVSGDGTHTTICCSVSPWRCRGGTQHRYWAVRVALTLQTSLDIRGHLSITNYYSLSYCIIYFIINCILLFIVYLLLIVYLLIKFINKKFIIYNTIMKKYNKLNTVVYKH